MFEAFVSFFTLVICYLTYAVYKEHVNENAKRMALIASIEHLRKIETNEQTSKTTKAWAIEEKVSYPARRLALIKGVTNPL